MTMDDAAIRSVVARLSRSHRSGGKVIERAAILAAGSDSAAILAWITAHDGEPESTAPAAASRGLHGDRFGSTAPVAAQRYVLPPGALTADEPA
jgi:hypothetical protein